jgi:hypothetical protein
MKVLVATAVGLLVAALPGGAIRATAAEKAPVTAVDILLEPDTTMLSHAQAVSARLLKAYPNGFALDETHRPHITLIQRFVRTRDLDQVYAAAGQVVARSNVRSMRLDAVRYGYSPGGDTGVAGIFVRPTPELLRLQRDLISAVAPYTVETGPIGAFTAAHDDPANDAALISYVATFAPKQTGEHFQPHVSTGVAPKAYLDKMSTEPFAPFSFSPVGAAIYQLGPFGTAAKRLKALATER